MLDGLSPWWFILLGALSSIGVSTCMLLLVRHGKIKNPNVGFFLVSLIIANLFIFFILSIAQVEKNSLTKIEERFGTAVAKEVEAGPRNVAYQVSKDEFIADFGNTKEVYKVGGKVVPGSARKSDYPYVSRDGDLLLLVLSERAHEFYMIKQLSAPVVESK